MRTVICNRYLDKSYLVKCLVSLVKITQTFKAVLGLVRVFRLKPRVEGNSKST